jgi:hypothetical protein
MKNENPLKVKQTRNSFGLIEGVEYIFNTDGSINWRSMVKSEFLFPNRSWFEARKQQMPSSIDGLTDAQLLIKLGGIKELAKLRGFKSVKYDIIKCEPTYVAVKCGITWIPNFESENEIYFEDMANATVNNTSDFAIKFLETIAANRAFVRSVRNFLNIHIVGGDEMDSSKKGTPAIYEEEAETSLPSSQGMLEKTAKKAGMKNFSEFQDYLHNANLLKVYSNNESKVWTTWTDIPAKEARILMSIINGK